MVFIQGKTEGSKTSGRGKSAGLIFWAALLALSLANEGCVGVTGASNNGSPDTTAPSVSISSPAAGSAVSGTVNVVAIATDDTGVAGVQFKVDGANAGAEDTVPPFAFSWNTSGLSSGSHTLTAIARDAAGNAATSAPIVVSVGSGSTDSTAPSISITSPANGASASGTITVQVNASDNVGVAGVQFKVDGVNTGAEDTVAPFSYSWNTSSLSNGGHSLTAVARDAAGNTATSAAVSVNVNNATPDTTAPSVSISAPPAGATVSGSVSISANASDNVGVVGVQFKVDGANAGAEDSSAPYSVSWNSGGVSNGSHSITAVARDAAGNSRTSTAVSVTVNNVAPDSTAPTVSISAPAGGASVSGSVSITATASDNVGVVGVQFKVDGTNAGAEDSTSPYSISWDTLTIANGSHSITAVARDAAGNTKTSAAVSVSVNNASSSGRVITISPSNADATCNEEFENVANTLQPGDTLILRGGVYSQSCRRAITLNGTAANPITIRAATGETPILTRPANNIDTQNNIEIVSSTYLILKGIQFQGGSSGVRFVNNNNFITIEDCEILQTGNNAIAVNSGNSDGLTIRHNHIHHTGLSTSATEGEGMYLGCNNNACRVTNSLVDSNYIHHTRGTSSGGNDGIEVKVGSGGNTVRNNVVHDTNIGQQFPAIFVYGGGAQPNIVEGNVMWNCGECIQVEADAVIRNNIILNHSITGIAAIPHAQVATMKDVTIVNNTIYGGPECAALNWSSATNMTFANNAVYCSSGTAVSGSGLTRTGITLKNNYVSGALSGASVDNNTFFNGGSATAAFVNPATMNVWPTTGSVLRGTANASFAPGNDFNGTARTSPYDAGAYETEGLASNPGWAVQPGFKSGSAPSSGDTTAPSVSITSPSNGQSVSGTITVTASASDNVGVAGVQFKVDGVNTGTEVTSSPWTYSLNTGSLAAGNHTLTAVARDAAGNSTTSVGVTINIAAGTGDSTPPTVSVTAPSNGQTVSGTVTFSANASDNVGVAGVQFKVDGVNQGAEDTSAPYSVSVNTAGLSNGSHTFSAVARDATSLTATASINVAVSNQPAGTCGSAVTDITRTIAVSTLARPALLQQYTDPDFGACIKRVTDSQALGVDSAVHTYSELQAWSADQSLILLTTNQIIDATTYQLVHEIDFGWPGTGKAVRWSPTEPRVLYYIGGLDSGSDGIACAAGKARLMRYRLSSGSPASGTRELMHCFTEYSDLDKNASYQEMSSDGRYIALMSSSGQGFLYDLVANQKLATVAVGSIEWVEPSPLGDYLLINFGGGGDGSRAGVEAYNPQTGAYVGKVATGHGHGSTALAPDGSQWYVYSTFDNYVGVTGPKIVKARIPRGYDDWKAGNTSSIVSLVDIGWNTNLHISCRTPRGEWCAAGTYATSGSVRPFYEEVFRVSLNSTEAAPKVERLAHHRTDYNWVFNTASCSMSAYWAQPHASTSRDGSKIIFGSSWGQVCRAEAYVIQLTGSSTPPSSTLPVVSITSPASGTSVSGTVSLTANATSSTSIAGVQFKVDGVNIGAEDTTAPYSASLDTRTLSNGSHTVTAVARDSASNTTTSGSVNINVNNTTSDTTPPVISGVLASPNVSSAVISWATNEAADSQMEYGVTTAYGQSSSLDTTKVMGHSATLTGLLSNTTYNFRVKSRDAAGNLAVSANQTFKTLNQASSGIPSTLGWFQIPNTKQSGVCPPDAFGYSFSAKCGSVIGAWGGGIADTQRNRLVFWGGGHVDYAGNEVYALELSTLTMKRLNNPSAPTSGSSPASSDGKANSRHTYNGLAYIEHLDKMFAFSGSLYDSGVAVNDTWLLDMATLAWKRVSATGPSGDYNVHAHYDAVTKKVFVADRSELWRFDPDTEQYTRVGSLGMGLATTSVIDPKRRLLFVFGTDWGGSKQFSAINVDTGQPVSMTLTGCDGLITNAPVGNTEGSGPGLAYDPVQDRIVGWVTGNTVYILNPDTRSCTTQSFTGGPGAPTQQGIYGRLRYFPALGVFALVNESNQDSFTLRLTPALSTAQLSEVVISGVVAVNVTATSATVVWTTSTWADGQVACGVFSPDGIRSPLDLTPAINHAHTLNFMDPDTTYQCQAMSRDSSGQLAVSPVFSFRTAKAVVAP